MLDPKPIEVVDFTVTIYPQVDKSILFLLRVTGTLQDATLTTGSNHRNNITLFSILLIEGL